MQVQYHTTGSWEASCTVRFICTVHTGVEILYSKSSKTKNRTCCAVFAGIPTTTGNTSTPSVNLLIVLLLFFPWTLSYRGEYGFETESSVCLGGDIWQFWLPLGPCHRFVCRWDLSLFGVVESLWIPNSVSNFFCSRRSRSPPCLPFQRSTRYVIVRRPFVLPSLYWSSKTPSPGWNRSSATRFLLSQRKRKTSCIRSRTSAPLLVTNASPRRTRLCTAGTATMNGLYALSRPEMTTRSVKPTGSTPWVSAPTIGLKTGMKAGRREVSLESRFRACTWFCLRMGSLEISPKVKV